jgi:C1A family cysteine protease
MAKKSKGYGWVPDLPDHRDFLYSAIRRAPRKLPPSVDLSPGCSAVENQGQLGSCTGNALAGALEFLERKAGTSFADMSRLFIYYNERVIEHSVKTDSGAMIRDGIKTLAAQGACTEKKWPYNVAQFAAKPSAACYSEAKKHKISTYHRIVTLDDMRGCLSEGYPFIFGFTVYDSFESQAVAKSGVVPMPKESEKVLGGHAVLGVGYNDAAKRFVVRNSWGAGWGKAGYFTIPYAYLGNSNLADDFWTIRS